MCNLYTQTRSPDEIAAIFRDLQMPLSFPEGIPNLQPRDIAITDPGPVIRARIGNPGQYELLVRRWSWPQSAGKPLYNLKSEGRDFPRDRALALADGFYEFTTPADPKAKRKDRWVFRPTGFPMLGIAALLRRSPEVGEAYTLLTMPPGPDVAPFHGRQIVLLSPDKWTAWLDGTAASKDLFQPLPAGSLSAEPAPR
ncbi:MAG TPA: SOS response-associated peptidase family protein [Sphingomicrobium sp.]|nr:SOS response-associated peptidase family protein [Sphingomicrobium sp.]